VIYAPETPKKKKPVSAATLKKKTVSPVKNKTDRKPADADTAVPASTVSPPQKAVSAP
jgi:hypothetical protein